MARVHELGSSCPANGENSDVDGTEREWGVDGTAAGSSVDGGVSPVVVCGCEGLACPSVAVVVVLDLDLTHPRELSCRSSRSWRLEGRMTLWSKSTGTSDPTEGCPAAVRGSP